jgi:hypothetical protein
MMVLCCCTFVYVASQIACNFQMKNIAGMIDKSLKFNICRPKKSYQTTLNN